MLKIKRIARQLGSAEAAEIAEAALVLPVVFTLLLGIIWFGRAFNISSTIQQAAQQGAIAAARNPCATCGTGLPNGLPNPTAAADAVVALLRANSLDSGKIQQGPNPKVANPNLQPCPPPAPPAGSCTATAGSAGTYNIWVCSSVLLNSSTQPAQCGAMVSFQYPFTFNLLSLTPLPSITLSAQAQSRMEN